MKSRIPRAFRFLLLIVWMIVIYYFSDQPNSNETTLELFGSFNYWVRKGAHMTEYAILFLLFFVCIPIRASNPLKVGSTALGSTTIREASEDAATNLAINNVNTNPASNNTNPNPASNNTNTNPASNNANPNLASNNTNPNLASNNTNPNPESNNANPNPTVGITFNNALILSFVLTVIYACTDEWHQSFVLGRSALFSDVLIDACGAFMASMILFCKQRLQN
ncbi:MAG: VanZ family protein [Candidatus Obscuribacterales bacterium]|nr:VanZ family protein [Candidatus Obscuribacterales bacterium]